MMLVVCKNAADAFDLAEKAGRGRGPTQVRCMPSRPILLPSGKTAIVPMRWLVTVRGLSERQEQKIVREAGLESD